MKRWVAELRDVPPKLILRHHLDPVPDYPEALVDWKESSRQMKDDFWAIKALPETRALAEQVYARHGSRKPPSARRGGRKAVPAKGPSTQKAEG